MNPSIKKLAELSSKPTKTIVGLMSGTSLDGLDIALTEISGSGSDTSVKLKKFTTVTYDSEMQKRLRAISSVPEASLEEICLMHSWLGNQHGKFILEALDKWGIGPSEVDCIASHGQTIYHAPQIQHGQEDMPNATLQIGDGDHIAHTTGILTISDFRQKHTAAGGEGAPMVSFVDRILYRDDTEDRVLLNIGGIANFTYLPAKKNKGSQSVTTDTGPGNTLIDAAAQKYFSKSYDQDGKIARKGSINKELLQALKSDSYFQKSLPKTTGPEIFNLKWVNDHIEKAAINDLSSEDLIATLTRLTAETIADCIREIIVNKEAAIYASGGGIHNPVLMEWLWELIPEAIIKNFETIGFNPDAKEAVLFAVLANEMLCGEGFGMEADNLSPNKPINFGKISFPF